jgi:acyl-coenzyme A synthetase/AMP-(fatty) acid ligase
MKFNSIVEAIKAFALLTPDKVCLADDAGDITYRKYYRKICGAASFLLKKGVNSGDRVVASNTQRINYFIICHAVQMIGGVFVPLEKNAGIERIHDIIRQTEAVMYVGNISVEACPRIEYSEFSKFEAEEEPCRLPASDADSMILFTTGTTGVSKGILLVHSAEVAVAENVKYGVEMEEDNVEIIPMPINHSFGLRRYFGNMINGSTVILLDGVVFTDRLFRMMSRYRATSIAMAPAALAIIFKLSKDKIGEYGSQLDYIQFGSAPLPELEKEKLLHLLPDCRLYNMYGTTEAGCSCILNFNSMENRPNCIGRPTVNSHLIVVDEKGQPIITSKNNPGYLLCSGSMSMKEYYRDSALTASTLKRGCIYTNDIGYIDSNGLIYILGRADDVINTGGNKISPGEIEEIVSAFPGIVDCACASMKDPLLGQVPKLFVVADRSFNIESLYNYLAGKMEKYKLPKAIEIVSEIPHTYNGKIWRKKLAVL